jgi:hypothetical protein
MRGKRTRVQRLGWFQQDRGVELPEEFEDDLALQSRGVRHYREIVEANYGRISEDRLDLRREHRNYLIDCMRLSDRDFGCVVDAVDRLGRWEGTAWWRIRPQAARAAAPRRSATAC